MMRLHSLRRQCCHCLSACYLISSGDVTWYRLRRSSMMRPKAERSVSLKVATTVSSLSIMIAESWACWQCLQLGFTVVAIWWIHSAPNHATRLYDNCPSGPYEADINKKSCLCWTLIDSTANMPVRVIVLMWARRMSSFCRAMFLHFFD